MRDPEIVVLPDPEALAHEAARRFLMAAQQAVDQRGRFAVALAGGSTPVGLYRLLAGPGYRDALSWRHTWVYFGDERCVPADHPDSNYRLAYESLLAHVPIPPEQVARIPGELDPESAAACYEGALRQDFALHIHDCPTFDLILLGMGEDGHTASLFPGLPALEERDRLAVATAVPPYARPAAPRVTLTLPVLNAARQVMFLVTGKRKAPAVAAVLGTVVIRCNSSADTQLVRALPASLVHPCRGRLVWLLDRAAAGQIALQALP